jgi:hypothetical protein
MARRSRWQNFSDNFNSVYGSFNKLGKDIESKKVMNSDYTDDDGNALAGDALDRRRMMELSKVYTKYGDAEGGLGLRAQQAKIEADKRNNDLQSRILDHLVKQQGELTTSQMESDIASTDATTNDTRSTTNRRDTLLPGEVDQQAATLDNTVASTDNTRSTINRRDALLPGEVENANLVNQGLGSANRSSAAQADVDEALVDANVNRGVAESNSAISNSLVAADNAEISGKTLNSTIDAENDGNALKSAEAALGINTAENALAAATTEDVILSEVMNAGHEDSAAADADAIARIRNSDLPLERQRELISTIQSMSLEGLVNEGAQFTQAGLNALGQGLEQGIEWYDTINNNDTLTIDRESVPGSVIINSAVGDTVTELFRADGPNADSQIIAELATRIQKPSAALTVAAQVADIAKSEQATDESASRTSLLDSQKFSEILGQDTERARKMLLDAQVAKTRQDIEQAGRGLQGADLIAREGLADLQKSAEFIMLGDQEGGAALQAETLGNYMRVMRMADAPPAGVESQLWFSMTDEEKAAFQ